MTREYYHIQKWKKDEQKRYVSRGREDDLVFSDDDEFEDAFADNDAAILRTSETTFFSLFFESNDDPVVVKWFCKSCIEESKAFLLIVAKFDDDINDE